MKLNLPIKNNKSIPLSEINKLMKKHEGLIKFFYYKYSNFYRNNWEKMCQRSLNYVDTDDIYQACYIGTWFAILTHEESKGKFSSWVEIYIKRLFYDFMERGKNKTKLYQFSELDLYDENGDVILYEDTIVDETNTSIKSNYAKDIDNYIDSLEKEQYKNIFSQRIAGMKYPEMAIRNGITKEMTQIKPRIYTK